MIMITDDNVFEGEEYFTLAIRNLTGFENVTTTVFIQDNEGELYTLIPIRSRTILMTCTLIIIIYSTEFTAVWTQEEYTVAESAMVAMGEVEITFPTGSSVVAVDVQFTFQDVDAIGGQRIFT